MNNNSENFNKIFEMAKNQVKQNNLTREDIKKMYLSMDTSLVSQYLGKDAEIKEEELNRIYNFLGV